VIAGYPKTKIKQFTHNGVTATGTTHVYTGPVTVGKCNVMFFEARAYKSGMTDSVVTTYNADYTGAPTCGGAKLFSDDATLSGSDSASDYQLVAYTGGSSARNKARQSISDRPVRSDAAAYMSDAGFMRVALNSSSPERSRKTTALPSTSATTTAPRGATVIYSVWDGDWAILEEYDNNGNRVQGYVEGYHGLVKTLVNNIYYYQDELGSTSHVADANGALLEYYKYNLYGKPTYWNAANTQIPSSNYQVQDLGNGGSRWIPQLGLYDDRNRFMSPDLGRFLQPDPIGFKGDASNLYRYCGNDWANRTDPTGLLTGGGTDRQPETTPSDGPGHDFQRELSKMEQQNQVNVDAHHVENMEKARAESHPAVSGQNIGQINAKKAPRGDPKSSDAPTGLRIIGKIHKGHFDFYKIQLVRGQVYLKDKGSYMRENVSPTGDTKASDIQTSNGTYVNMTRGVGLDRVGPLTPPSGDVTRTFTAHQLYDSVIYKGLEYPMHAEFNQISRIQKGDVTTQLIPLNPTGE
jgi:RHS repeat-associated protein